MSPAGRVASIVPRPVSITVGTGSYDLADVRVISAAAPLAGAADLLLHWCAQWGVPARPGEDGEVRFEVDRSLADEGYELLIADDGVTVRAREVAGARHALQSLRQLVPPPAWALRPARSLVVPSVRIADRPRFAWRGAMLDIARRYVPVPYILRYLELLAAHKLNVLHLHLTEDSGWRMEIGRYPLLTEVGARRAGTVIGRGVDGDPTDGIVHEGHYTQAELRQIVAHAADLGITVVPEIDLPGHTRAAIAAYPELGNRPERLTVSTGWGVGTHVLNVSDATLEFFRGVLAEVVDVFPGAHVHLGGDECVSTEWAASAAAQARMRAAGLGHERELVGWFVNHMADFLRSRGRRAIAWDEVVESGGASDLTIMSWRSAGRGLDALRRGYDVIMTPQEKTYFDFYQSPDVEREPLAIGRLLTLQDAYDWDPAPAAASELPGRVLGTQYQIWAEYIDGPRAVEYMTFPRACAFAEVAWSQDKDYPDFAARLPTHLRRLDSAGVNYRPLSAP